MDNKKVFTIYDFLDGTVGVLVDKKTHYGVKELAYRIKKYTVENHYLLSWSWPFMGLEDYLMDIESGPIHYVNKNFFGLNNPEIHVTGASKDYDGLPEYVIMLEELLVDDEKCNSYSIEEETYMNVLFA